MKIIDLIQGENPWLEYRKTKIMASESSIILGHSDYATPFELWQRKLGLISEQNETEPMRRGKNLEPIARQKFCDGWGIEMIPMVGESEIHPWLAASFDGINFDEKSILEIKCNGKKNHDIALGGEVPFCHWIQMQHQMYVANVALGYYYSFDGTDGVTIQVKSDKDYFDSVIPQLYAFWRGLILFEPPALTNRDYKDMSKNTLWEQLSEKYRLLDAEIKAKEEAKDSIRKELIALCADANCKGNGIKMLKTVQKGRIQYGDILEIQHIDLEKYRGKPSTSWRVYVE